MKYFKLSEFDQPGLPGSGVNMDKKFLSMLDKARELAGIPFVVVRGGGWRSKEYQSSIYNKKGKAPLLNSYHLKGRAADISYNTESDLYKIIDAAWKSGIKGYGINNGAIHLDSRPRLSVWGYDKTKNTALYQKAEKYIKSLPALGTRPNPQQELGAFALPLLLATSLFAIWKLS